MVIILIQCWFPALMNKRQPTNSEFRWTNTISISKLSNRHHYCLFWCSGNGCPTLNFLISSIAALLSKNPAHFLVYSVQDISLEQTFIFLIVLFKYCISKVPNNWTSNHHHQYLFDCDIFCCAVSLGTTCQTLNFIIEVIYIVKHCQPDNVPS